MVVVAVVGGEPGLGGNRARGERRGMLLLGQKGPDVLNNDISARSEVRDGVDLGGVDDHVQHPGARVEDVGNKLRELVLDLLGVLVQGDAQATEAGVVNLCRPGLDGGGVGQPEGEQHGGCHRGPHGGVGCEFACARDADK